MKESTFVDTAWADEQGALIEGLFDITTKPNTVYENKLIHCFESGWDAHMLVMSDDNGDLFAQCQLRNTENGVTIESDQTSKEVIGKWTWGDMRLDVKCPYV
jgi:hypothetical protein